VALPNFFLIRNTVATVPHLVGWVRPLC